MGQLVLDATNKMGEPIANARSSLPTSSHCRARFQAGAWTPAGRGPAYGRTWRQPGGASRAVSASGGHSASS